MRLREGKALIRKRVVALLQLGAHYCLGMKPASRGKKDLPAMRLDSNSAAFCPRCGGTAGRHSVDRGDNGSRTDRAGAACSLPASAVSLFASGSFNMRAWVVAASVAAAITATGVARSQIAGVSHPV